MNGNRILFVSYNPATLIRNEKLLIRAGYEVDTVFGKDGVLACGSLTEYSSISIDEACPLEEREALTSWLTTNFPTLSILRAAW